MTGRSVRFQDDFEPNTTLGLRNAWEIGYITQFVTKNFCKVVLELCNDLGVGSSFGRTERDRI